MPDASSAWRCVVCGYIHRGPAPPDVCPVCGAVPESFEPVIEAAAVSGATADAGETWRAVVVGAGIAGIAAVESLRAAGSSVEITLVSQEAELPYYRLNLTRYLAGEIEADDLPVHPESWYAERNVRLLSGVEVSSLRLEEQAVELGDGRRLGFERLLLAAGAHPFVPPLPGVTRKGVTTLRTMVDADRILDAVARGAKCVCVGGGILGLETAGALVRRGADVTLLEGHGWLLPRQLNRRAGEILAEHVRAMGIDLKSGARPKEICGDDRARGVLLEDGTTARAELVVIATGVRPNSWLARRAGLEVNQGVVVDDRLTTSHPRVFAAGDVAEHRGVVYGTWGPSQHQGSIAGRNMAASRAEFGGIPRSNTLKVLGLDLFSIGQVVPEDGSYQTVEQRVGDRYSYFVFRDTHLVGAVLLGDATLTARVRRAVENRTDFSEVLRKGLDAEELMEKLGGA